MSGRTFLIAANWKMNLAPEGAFEDSSPYKPNDTVDVVVFPTLLDIHSSIDAGMITGAQYGELHPEGYGAHTGDISMQMLKDIGCQYVLCGHSERRRDHGETPRDVCNQVAVALEVGLHPIICIGETLEEREAGQERDMVYAQMCTVPFEVQEVTIAYEPVWAIGTGQTATPEQAQEMHAFIRSKLPEDRQETIRILYGGSMKPENAEDLLKQPDIDGALVGGASLDPQAFGKIVEIAAKLRIEN